MMKKRFETVKLFVGVLLQGVLSGVAVGCLAGFLEVMVIPETPAGIKTSLLIPAMLFYSLFWSAAALLFGGVLFTVSKLCRASLSTGEHLTRWYFAVLIPVSLFSIGGGHANLRFLPAMTHPISLGFNLCFFIANVFLGYWIYHDGVSRVSRFVRGRPRWVWISLALGIFGMGLMFVVSSWNKEKTRAIIPPAVVSSAPNVLVLTIDALRPDHMSLYGYSRSTTPHIDQLAKEGVSFLNAFVNSSWTRASVASLFTSLYPSTHGVNGIASGLSPSLSPLPKLMKAQGYATGIFSANPFISPLFGYGSGVDRFHSRQVSIFNELILGHIFLALRKYSPALHWFYSTLENLELPFGGENRETTQASELNQAFLNWVETLDNRPFFAYFHFMETHTPYSPHPPFDQKFVDPNYSGPPQTDAPIFEAFYPFTKAEALPPEKFDNLVAQYDGAIAYVDDQLGKLFHELKKRGLYDHTIIMVTADHGEEFYGHKGWGHGKSLFNEVIRVPLVIRYPNLFRGGQNLQTVVRHIDLMPTILEWAGAPAPDSAEGRSFASLMREPDEATVSPPVYSEVIHENSYARSVIENGLKLIEVHVYDQEAWLLYDLLQDPHEQNPLNVETHPMAPKLKQLISSFSKRAVLKAVTPEKAEIDSDTVERLRSLGYVR